MKPETRLRRHAQLWESGIASARRVAIGGLIFAVLILLRVVEPYHQVERKGEEAKANLVVEAATLEKRQDRLTIIEQTLQEIEDELEEEPWNVEKNRLIRFFEERGSDDSAVPQNEANTTILNIVEMVEVRVIDKLSAVMAAADTSERLVDYPGRIKASLDQWKTDNYDNTQWYFTVESKDETIRGMSKVLSALKNEALTAVKESRLDLQDQSVCIETRRAEIKNEIAEKTKGIKVDLDKILPSWAQNSVGVQSMMVFYPWILVAFAASLVGNGIIAARHFHGMADEEQWTAAERSEPLLTSQWTLTWRGAAGTAVAIANYSAVILVLGFCLTRAGDPPSLEDSESSDGTAVADLLHSIAETMSAVLPVTLAYGFLLAAFAAIVVTPLLWRAQKP